MCFYCKGSFSVLHPIVFFPAKTFSSMWTVINEAEICIKWTGCLITHYVIMWYITVITWTEYFLSREKLNAVCDRNASQNNPNLSVWEHKTVNLYKNLLLVLDTLGLVVSTQPKVDLCLYPSYSYLLHYEYNYTN